MTAEQWEQVKQTFAHALELTSPQRESYVDAACASDPVLLHEVRRLLDAERQAGSGFLNLPTRSVTLEINDTTHDKMSGRRVGAYQVAERIGAGGMGEVYRAFRADDEYSKQVALKVVRSGQGSRFVLERFKNERQILASLDHPNIARLLDGGTTDDGAPYFVMELIEGKSLYDYCDEHKLQILDRLKLFLRVSSAVQFAHQHLIVHRDIKPGNILVTADGTPKLLDFGVSKILDADSSLNTADLTVTAFRAFTPAYASPEQIKGEPITTATDVYSLGVVLYELLTGRTPYSISTGTPREISRAVCEVEPEKPSAAVRRNLPRESTLPRPADYAAVSSVKLSKQLRGDLDSIVLKALRKEPGRRYASVEQFAGDIRRHLEHLPVAARKGTARYRTAKFVLRHRTGLAATAIVIVALLAGMAMTLVQKRRADRRFNDVRTLANSLLFEIHDSIRDLPGSTPARKLIVDRALTYLDSLSAEGGNDLSLMRELATAYERVGEVQGHYLQNSLGDTAGSLRSYQKALKVRQEVAARSHDWSDRLALAKSHRLVANQLWATGDLRGAFDNNSRAVTVAESLQKQRPTDLRVLDELARDYENASQVWGGSYPGAFDNHAKVAESIRKAAAVDAAMLKIDPNNEQTQRSYEISISNLGDLRRESDPAGALQDYRQALAIAEVLNRRSPTTQHLRDVAREYSQIGIVYWNHLFEPEPALENYRKCLQRYQQAAAADPENALLQQGLAIAYANVSDYDRGLEVGKKLVAKDPRNVQKRLILAAIYVNRGDDLLKRHESTRAADDFASACAIFRELRTPDTGDEIDRAVAECTFKAGYAALQSGRTQAADADFHESLTLTERFLPKDSLDREVLLHAADCYAGLGDLEARRAATESATGHNREEHWSRARDWYEKSLATSGRVPPQLRKRPADSPAEQDPKTVEEKLRRSEAAVAMGRILGQMR
ncbi:MAG TPA: protein kinase [Candidatus Sulfotelmatobacter sp.]|nr:protein kinase [Candidatus Sulfotelmatobacter sp.]